MSQVPPLSYQIRHTLPFRHMPCTRPLQCDPALLNCVFSFNAAFIDESSCRCSSSYYRSVIAMRMNMQSWELGRQCSWTRGC